MPTAGNLPVYEPDLWENMRLPNIEIERGQYYTIEIKTEHVDTLIKFGINKTSLWDSLSIYGSYKSDTIINELYFETPNQKFDSIVYVNAATTISETDTIINLTMQGDSLCGIPDEIETTYQLGGDTIMHPADTLYVKFDTLYNQYALGLTTFVATEVDSETTYSCPVVPDLKVTVLPDPIIISPNPVENQMVVDYIYYRDFNPEKIEIYTLDGQLLLSEIIANNTLYYHNKNRSYFGVDKISNLPNGIYVVSIQYGDEVFSEKFIKI